MDLEFKPDIIESNVKLPAYKSELEEIKLQEDVSNEAFYASALSGVEDPVDLYDNILQEYNSQGDSAVVRELRNQYSRSQDIMQASFVENIIADPGIDIETKRNLLKDISVGGYKSRSLRDAYLDEIANDYGATQTDGSEAALTTLNLQVRDIKVKQDWHKAMEMYADMLINGKIPEVNTAENEQVLKQLGPNWLEKIDEKIIDPVLAEPLMLFQQLVVGLVPYVAELLGTAVLAPTDRYTITTAREKARKVVAEHGGDWLIENYQDFAQWLGIEREDLEESYVTKAFTTLDEGLMWMAKKIAPDNPEAAKIPMELAMIFAVPAAKAGKQAYFRITDPTAYKVSKAFDKFDASKDMKAKSDPFFDTEKVQQTNIRTSEKLKLDIPVDSPFNVTKVNKRLAKDVAKMVMIDESGRFVKSLKMNVPQFIFSLMMPEIVRKPYLGEKFDATQSWRELVGEQFRAVREMAEGTLLQDSQQRRTFLNQTVNVVNEVNSGEVVKMTPGIDTVFIPEGNSIKMSLTFNKDGINNFKTFESAIDAATKLEETINKTVTDGNSGNIFIEHIDAQGKATPFTIKEARSLVLESDIAPNLRLRWAKNGEFFDAIADASGIMNQKPWMNNKFTSWLFDTSEGWNWAAVFGKSGKEFESSIGMGSMKAEQYLKSQTKILAENIGADIYNKKFTSALEKLYDLQQDKVDLMSISDIYSAIGEALPVDKVHKLQSALFLTRQIDRFNYKMLNVAEISRANNRGFNHYIEIIKETSDTPSRHMVTNEFKWDMDNLPEKVWDMEKDQAVDFILSEGNKAESPMAQFLFNSDNVPTRQYVKLDKPFFDDLGAEYNYAILPNRHKLTGNPNWIVPSRTGHMPRLAKGTFFIRAYPLQRVVDGKVIRANRDDATSVFKNDSTAVAMFDTEVAANKWKNDNIVSKATDPKLDADKYVFTVEKAKELTSLDDIQGTIDGAVLRGQTARSARAKGEELYNAIYEDPLTTFIKSSESMNTDVLMAPVIDQMKTLWVEAYIKGKKIDYIPDQNVKKLNESRTLDTQAELINQFPDKREHIQRIAEKDSDYKQALSEYDRITAMEVGNGGSDVAKYLAMISDRIGAVTDKDHKLMQHLSKIARKVERNPEAVLNAPLRVVSTAKIIMAPLWRNITLQPIGIFGPMLIANPRLFLSTMNNAAGTVYLRYMQNKANFKYNKYGDEVYKYMWEQENILNDTPAAKNNKLTLKDQQLILRELETSGLANVGDHILAKLSYSSSANALKGSSFLGGWAQRGLDVYSKMGFELGEYINRVGMWHATRVDWMSKNPGKNWRTREALDAISYGAWQLSGSMSKQATYKYQRSGVLRYIGQFQAFSGKASENIWNGGATPFNANQRAALAAYNLAVWGVRGGLIYGLGDLILNSLRNNNMEEIAEAMDDMTLANVITRVIGDTIAPTYDEDGNLILSKADVAAVYSPFGNNFGGPYGTFWKTLVQLTVGGVEDYRFGPTAQTIIQASENYQLFKAMYATEEFTLDEKFLRGVELLARLTSGGNALYNYTMYNALNEKVNKFGQSTGIPESKTDQFLRLFNVPSQTDKLQYDNMKRLKSGEERAKEFAGAIWQNLIAVRGAGGDTLADATTAFSTLRGLLRDVEFSDAELDIIFDELQTLDNRQFKSRQESYFEMLLEKTRIESDLQYSADEINGFKTFIETAPEGWKDEVEIFVNELSKQRKK